MFLMEEDIRESFKRQKTIHAWERDDSKMLQFNRVPGNFSTKMDVSPPQYLPPIQAITAFPNLGTFTPYHVPMPSAGSWNFQLPALQIPSPIPPNVIPKQLPEADKACTCSDFIPSLDQMGRDFHKESFMCSTCKMPLHRPHFKDGGMYCEKHAHGEEEVVSSHLEIFIRSNPETHQIANYNVYPAPSIALEKGITKTETVVASLVDNHSGVELQEGFQSGFRRIIKQGGNYLVFTGLKINKMGRIKNELRQKQIMKFDSFQIRFRIGTEFWDSTPFKLVSSCTQLPKETRSKVRPSKKSHHDEDAEANWISITDSPKTDPDPIKEMSDNSPKVTPLSSQSKTGPGSIQFLLE